MLPETGHPKVEAMLDELVYSGLDSDIGDEFTKRGITVQHIEFPGIYGLCFEVLPFRDDGTLNPSWTGPPPPLASGTVEACGGECTEARQELTETLPVAQAISIQRNINGASYTSGPSVYAVPMASS